MDLQPELGIEKIVDILNQKYSHKDKWRGFKGVMRENYKLEAICIGVCEAGDVFGGIAAYEIGFQSWNILGLPLGIIAGFGYAVMHTLKEGKEKSQHVGLKDAIPYALSAELGCVVGATSLETAAVNLGNTFSPYDPVTLGLTIGALPLAFGVGLVIMGGFSYYNKREVGSIIAESDSFPDVTDYVKKNFDDSGLQIHVSQRDLRLKGNHNNVVLSQRTIPHYLKKSLDPRKYSSHKIRLPVSRYDPGASQLTRDFFIGVYNQLSIPFQFESNIFHHGH